MAHAGHLNTTRRSLFAGAAATLVGTAVPAVALAADNAAQFEAWEAEANAILALDDTFTDQDGFRLMWLDAQMTANPAFGRRAHLVKARLAYRLAEDGACDDRQLPTLIEQIVSHLGDA